MLTGEAGEDTVTPLRGRLANQPQAAAVYDPIHTSTLLPVRMMLKSPDPEGDPSGRRCLLDSNKQQGSLPERLADHKSSQAGRAQWTCRCYRNSLVSRDPLDGWAQSPPPPWPL
jgi:hypothetical protein